MQAPPKTGKQSWGLCPLLIGRMRPSRKGRVSFNLGARSLAVTSGPDPAWAQPPPVGTGRWGRLAQPKRAHYSVGRGHLQTARCAAGRVGQAGEGDRLPSSQGRAGHAASESRYQSNCGHEHILSLRALPSWIQSFQKHSQHIQGRGGGPPCPQDAQAQGQPNQRCPHSCVNLAQRPAPPQ